MQIGEGGAIIFYGFVFWFMVGENAYLWLGLTWNRKMMLISLGIKLLCVGVLEVGTAYSLIKCLVSEKQIFNTIMDKSFN